MLCALDLITARTIGFKRLLCYPSSFAKPSESMDIKTKTGKVVVKVVFLGYTVGYVSLIHSFSVAFWCLSSCG